MGTNIRICLSDNYDKSLAPIPATKYKEWWEDNRRTVDHARHCLPLAMANSLGYYILSPGTFLVKWNGDHHAPAKIEIIEKSSHCIVDAHAAFGCFVVQSSFIPVTDDPGDFVIIKGIPNERGLPYHCMEACIEAWWNVGIFGMVFILNQPGEFLVQKGRPIAQMFLYHGVAGAAQIQIKEGYPEDTDVWMKRRYREGYTKDFDYMKGLTPSGVKVDTHITNWRDATKFR